MFQAPHWIWPASPRNAWTRLHPRAAAVLLVLPWAGAAPSQAATAPPEHATVYVNDYFEIRQHDVPVKHVFDGDTRVARVTGSISTNARIQRLRVFPGWNLGALVVSATNPARPSSPTGQPPSVSAAFKWVPQERAFQPMRQEEDLPPGTILWLHSTSNVILNMRGLHVPPTNRTFSGTGDFVALPGLEEWRPRDLLPENASTWTWLPGAATWKLHLGHATPGGSTLPEALAPGQAVFVRATGPFTVPAPAGPSGWRFYHQDHLGSSSVVTDGAGQLVNENAFYPFGQQRMRPAPSAKPEPYQFTQVERDAETGLDSFPARYYQSALSRFVQPDALHQQLDRAEPASQLLKSPQKLNPYAYVRNNPLKYVDPTGYDDEPPPQTVSPAPAASPTVGPPNLSLPPNAVPPVTGPPRVTFEPNPRNAGAGLTLPPVRYNAAQQAEAARLTLTGQSPEPPRPGSGVDLLRAIGKLQLNGKSLQDQAIGVVADPAKAGWQQASTGEKAAIITAGVVMAGVAAPALQNKEAASAIQTVIPQIVVPIPIGKNVQVNAGIGTIGISGRF